MSGGERLIVVSNRGPATFDRDAGGTRIAKRGGGGLAPALRSLVGRHDVTWIASALSEEDRVVARETGGAAFDERSADGTPFRLRLIAHDRQAYDWYYNVVANPVLWFVHHYLWGLATAPDVDRALKRAWARGYGEVNDAFATAVLEELDRDPGARVFFHDYHLYLAPAAVRAARPDVALVHFVHIPWPQPDYWSVLPEPVRRAIHEGVLANDVVGFHTRRWRRNFLRCCEEIVGAGVDYGTGVVRLGAREAAAVVAPISVDPAELTVLADGEQVLEEEARLEAGRPEVLILRVDRTDPAKNVVRGLRAYELYLEGHPEMHGRVGMLALLDPSRLDIPEYAEYLGAVLRATRRVNERFQRDGWLPLDLQVQDNFPQAVAAYKQFDVLLVNPIFDGMNLVVKEAPLVNRRDGVVLLSENAGAHEELAPWVISVNPFDVAGQAEALHRAITMPEEERRARAEAIRAHVRTHDIAAWIDAQDEALAAAASRIRP